MQKSQSTFGVRFFILLAAGGAILSGAPAPDNQTKPGRPDLRSILPGPAKAAIIADFGKLPMYFEPNLGQSDARVKFLAHGAGYTLFLTQDEAVMVLSRSASASPSPLQSGFGRGVSEQTTLRMKLEGARVSAPVSATGQQGISAYFLGNDSSRWLPNVPHFSRVEYKGVYPGIDLVYYGDQQNIEYDFVVAPGADPGLIRLAYDGADQVRVDKSGDLILETRLGILKQHRPRVYQQIGNSRVEVATNYRLEGRRVGLEVAAFDRRLPLVIDPVLTYSTYLGGTAGAEAHSVAVDTAGNVYVAGQTPSNNFPVLNASQSSYGGGTTDAFVTKFNKYSGTGAATLTYSTYLGGSGDEVAYGVAVDPSGAAYITGSTTSTNFPVVNAFQSTSGGGTHAFVTKLNPNTGTVAVTVDYSTYLLGNSTDTGLGIAVDSTGAAYVCGSTSSTNFPNVSASQTTFGGSTDAFVTKFNSHVGGAVTIAYSTYLGGSNADVGSAIAVDAFGAAYVTGSTHFGFFPVKNAFQSTSGGQYDAFVTKFSPFVGGTLSVAYSTYLGGGSDEFAYGIAVDSSGGAYIAGTTSSTDFPTANAYQTVLGGGIDGFVSKFNPYFGTGNVTLAYSTYLGGSNTEIVNGLAVDAAGAAYVAGATASTNFPMVNAIQPANAGGAADAVFVKVDPYYGNGPITLAYSTYLGGSGFDQAFGVAVDKTGAAHFAGFTDSTNFPVVNAYQPTYGAGSSHTGFVSQVSAQTRTQLRDFRGISKSDVFLYDKNVGNSYAGLTNGDGTYTYVYAPYTIRFDTLRTGDFNADGKADMVLYNSANALAYLGLGKGDGTFNFQSLFWSPGFDSVVAGDLNGDFKTDFILYRRTDGTVYSAISNGTGGFNYKYTLVSIGFTDVKVADFNGDGRDDVFFYRASDGLAYLGLGNGDGTFAFGPISVPPAFDTVQVGDINGDGKADLLLYYSGNGVTLTGISTGAGFTFSTQSYTPGFSAVRLLDINGDGKSDIVLYNKTNAIGYYGIGAGDGTFTFGSLFWGFGMDVVEPQDLNGDGKADIVLYNSATGTSYSGIGNGAGGFAYTYAYWGIGKTLAR